MSKAKYPTPNDPNHYPGADYGPPDACRSCGGELWVEFATVADGCPCNSPRGVNHGLVPVNTCTCIECDPKQTGASRYGTIRIESRFSLGDGSIPVFDELTIKNEPMLFNCDLESAYTLSGPVTKQVLDLLPPDWKKVPLVVDSRVHMLMPGWYPCIPGWHHDDVPRTRSDGQPNYDYGQCRSEHIICLVNGDICPTGIATGSVNFKVPGIGRTIYEDWHPQVEAAIKTGELTLRYAPSNQLVRIDDRTWHTGTPAIKTGWRAFIRVSRYYSPTGEPIARTNDRTNEVRRQVQVYLSNPNAGW